MKAELENLLNKTRSLFLLGISIPIIFMYSGNINAGEIPSSTYKTPGVSERGNVFFYKGQCFNLCTPERRYVLETVKFDKSNSIVTIMTNTINGNAKVYAPEGEKSSIILGGYLFDFIAHYKDNGSIELLNDGCVNKKIRKIN